MCVEKVIHHLASVLRLSCVCLASVLPLSCHCLASVLPLSCVCLASVLRLSCVYLASVLPLFCVASVLLSVLPLFCCPPWCLAFVLPLFCSCSVLPLSCCLPCLCLAPTLPLPCLCFASALRLSCLCLAVRLCLGLPFSTPASSVRHCLTGIVLFALCLYPSPSGLASLSCSGRGRSGHVHGPPVSASSRDSDPRPGCLLDGNTPREELLIRDSQLTGATDRIAGASSSPLPLDSAPTFWQA
jgi:hypothetical protein